MIALCSHVLKKDISSRWFRRVQSREVVEDRRLHGPLVPNRTGSLIRVDRAASDERETEKDFRPHPIVYARSKRGSSQMFINKVWGERPGRPPPSSWGRQARRRRRRS